MRRPLISVYCSYSFMLTTKCFLNCSHCITRRGKRYARDTMALSDVETIVDKIMGLSGGVTDFSWGGGEPLTLGREYMQKLVSLGCFGRKGVRNTVYTTLMLKEFDSGWVDILSRFDAVIFSLDSYRKNVPNYEEALALSNLKKLSLEAAISYTPSISDDATEFYLKSIDTGASRFHMGFLYGQSLPADFYLRLLDELISLYEKYRGPEIGFFSPGSKASGNSSLKGWTAYSCFTSGAFISPDLIMTSCVPLYYADPGRVPSIPVSAFLENDKPFPAYNEDFIRRFFLQSLPEECRTCDYYSLCMRGCPYFSREESGKDIYCRVYKNIFSYFLSRH